MENDVILSQHDIDALLAGGSEESTSSSVPVEATKPADVAETLIAQSTAHLDSENKEASSDESVTLDQVVAIAGEAAEAEAAPVHASISRIYQRIGELETALVRVAELEREVERLKNKS